MPKHPPNQKRLFRYKDITDRLVCPNCRRIVKTVIPATSVTYLIHKNGEVCVLENSRGVPDGKS